VLEQRGHGRSVGVPRRSRPTKNGVIPLQIQITRQRGWVSRKVEEAVDFGNITPGSQLQHDHQLASSLAPLADSATRDKQRRRQLEHDCQLIDPIIGVSVIDDDHVRASTSIYQRSQPGNIRVPPSLGCSNHPIHPASATCPNAAAAARNSQSRGSLSHVSARPCILTLSS
jgi:hypothetical protein